MHKHTKFFIKKFLLPLAGMKLFQPVYRAMHRASLAGMNIGPVGEIQTSGETALAKKLLQFAPNRSVIMDIGANVGEFCLFCAAQASGGKKSRIFAFEPSPSIHERLCANIRAARSCDQVTGIPLGLSSRSRNTHLYVTQGYEGNSSLYTRPLGHLTESAADEQIQLVTLDEFCSKHGVNHIFFVKIDIEGEEFACLQGAQNLISHDRIDYIQFEFGGCNIQSRVFLRDFWELLTPRYDLFRVLQRGLDPIPKYHELLEIFTTTNFLAVRRGERIPV